MEIDVSGIAQGGVAAKRALTSNSDFETFLRMLTTQVQNQDPLSPLETNEFANQLAAFTMVEQQTLTNQTLGDLLAALDRRDIGGYATLVGKTALHQAPFFFSGQTISLEIAGLQSESAVKLSILDSAGAVVAEQPVSSDAQRVEWSGRSFDGSIVPPGQYSAQLRSAEDDTPLEAQIGVEATVEEIRFLGADVQLLMQDGSLVPESSVLSLR